ncbi:apolipoprotein N-acyltransferase [Agrobacterium vaccinii]|uniref:apolipoprotein N-acyltransferase n=1 Tax=Agrobacterium vaccinii TaxID=2735528 RepID=UPI001E3EBBB3|nr:apolipoprotein N-acyltransferase [Agrobacterium vaccinii]UHS60057.1 apolipoprotein N-acyltransferase [Agrobacterium vaccinii]
MERLAGRIMLSSGFGRVVMTIGAGAIGALAFPPFGFFASLFVSFTLLVWLIDGATGNPDGGLSSRGWKTFVIGWLFGFGYFVAGLWWLGNALLLEADEFAWALPLAILGLPACLAIFYGFAVMLANLLWSDGWGRIAALAAAFGLIEWLRSFLLTGFPWNTVGYGLMPFPLMMQTSNLIGIFGMSMLAVFVFSSPALLGTKKGLLPGLGIALLMMAVHLGYGAYRLQQPLNSDSDALTVRIVQPGIDQSRKMLNADRAEIFKEHLRLSALPVKDGEKRPDIIVWPETSVPFILTQNPDALEEIAKTLDDGQILLTGAVRMEDAGAGHAPRYYNSVYAIDSQGQIIGATDKVHLVPFGEYVPFENVLRNFGIDNLISLPGGFSPAATREPITLPSGKKLHSFICYEIIFPGEVPADIATSTAIVNVTNDGWFGDTPGPYQHLQQARIRAVETGIPVIRAANTGISAIIDPLGRIAAGLDYGQKGIIGSTLSGAATGAFTGDMRQIHFWLFFGILLVCAVIARTGLMKSKN